MVFRRLRNDLISGLLIFLPAVISIYIMSFLFIKTTDYIFNLFPEITVHNMQMKILIRIIALIILMSVLILLGMFGRNVIGKRFLHLGETIVLRIPLLGKIYTAVKQVSEAFLGYDSNVLRTVCLIEFPRKGLLAVGFITATSLEEIQTKCEEKVINVFVPTTPNPTSGFLIIVPEKDIIPLEMSIEDGLKLVISGGAVVPPPTNKPQNNKSKVNNEKGL